MSDQTVMDYIPEDVPPRSLTSEGVNYPAEDSAGAPWEDAVVPRASEDGPVPLSEVTLEGFPLTQIRLYDDMDWDEIDLAVVAEMPNGWQSVLLVTLVVDGDEQWLEGVSVPGTSFQRGVNPPQWRFLFGRELRQRVQAGSIDTVGANLDVVLGFADEEY